MKSGLPPPPPSLFSVESGPNEPPKVPGVAAVLLSRGPAPLRVPGAAGRRGLSPPAAGFTPARRQVRTRGRRREQEQEGAPEPHGVHRAAADGPGETLREAEISVHP